MTFVDCKCCGHTYTCITNLDDEIHCCSTALKETCKAMPCCILPMAFFACLTAPILICQCLIGNGIVKHRNMKRENDKKEIEFLLLDNVKERGIVNIIKEYNGELITDGPERMSM